MGEIKDVQFFSGGLNLDMDPRFLPEGDYPYAINVLIGASEGVNEGDVENVKGNLDVGYIPEVGDKVIGYCDNLAKNSILFFVDSATDLYKIIEYNITTRDVRVILNSPELNFVTGFPVIHANIIDDELYWTDDQNHPRAIDIERAYNYMQVQAGLPWTGKDPYTTITQEILNNGVKPPLTRPEIAFVDNIFYGRNNFVNKTYKFRYAFFTQNYQLSALSSFSELALPQIDFGIPLAIQQNELVITGDAGTEDIVLEIVLYLQNENGLWAEFQRIPRDTVVGSTFTYSFFGNEAVDYIDENLAAKIFDGMPLRAACQEFIGDTHLVYANIVDGYVEPKQPDFSISLIKTQLNPFDDNVTKQWKRGDQRKVGIIYKDDYGRTSTVLTRDDAIFEIPQPYEEDDLPFPPILARYERWNVRRDLRIDIKSEAPSWAKYWQVVVSQSLRYDDFIQFVDYGVILKLDPITFGYYFELRNPVAYDISIGDEFSVYWLFPPDGDGEFYFLTNEYEFLNENVISSTITKIEGNRYYLEPRVAGQYGTITITQNGLHFFKLLHLR